MDPLGDYDFQGVTLNDQQLEQELETYQSVYDKARDFSPALKSAQLNLEASKKSYRISQFNWMPSLSVNAGYGTGWSSNIKDIDGDGSRFKYSV